MIGSNDMKKVVHALSFSRNDLANALRSKNINSWNIKSFDEAMKMNSITAAVNHVIDNP